MAKHRSGNMPSYETMMVLFTDAYVCVSLSLNE